MAISDGHVLLVESRAQDSGIHAVDFNGNTLTFSDREQTLFNGERSFGLPFTIYQGWAYYHLDANSNRVEMYDLNSNRHRRQPTFVGNTIQSTRFATTDVANESLIAMHQEPRWDPIYGRRDRWTGQLEIIGWQSHPLYNTYTVREWGLPAEINQIGETGRVLVELDDGTHPGAYVDEPLMRRLWPSWGEQQHRLYVSDSTVVFWFTGRQPETYWPIASHRGGYGGGILGELRTSPTYRALPQTLPSRMFEWNEGFILHQARASGHQAYLTTAGRFAVAGGGTYLFGRAGELWKGSGIHGVDFSRPETFRLVTGLDPNFKVTATKWHIWVHWHTHQVRRYDLLGNNPRTINVLPVGEQIVDFRAYTHNQRDFRDAPIGVQEPSGSVPAPPLPRLDNPTVPLVNWSAKLPLQWEWTYDRTFDAQQVRRRLVTNRGEANEVLGDWQYFDIRWGGDEAAIIRHARFWREVVPSTWTFDEEDLGRAGEDYDFGFRWRDDDTGKWTAWSSYQVSLADRVTLGEPGFWLVGRDGDAAATWKVNLPPGETGTEIWMERVRNLPPARLIYKQWWSGVDQQWVNLNPKPAATGPLNDIVDIVLPAGWQDPASTMYYRVRYVTAASESEFTAFLAVTTNPRERAEAPMITSPVSPATLDGHYPLVFDGTVGDAEIGHEFWLRRRRHGTTTYFTWSPSQGWVLGLPQKDDRNPSFKLDTRRRDRTSFTFELDHGWQGNLERFYYSIAYRSRNGFFSEWSEEVDVTNIEPESSTDREGFILARSPNGTVRSYDWGVTVRDQLGDDEMANLRQIVTAYGGVLPDVIFRGEAYYTTLTGIEARSIRTGATRTRLTLDARFQYARLAMNDDNSIAYAVRRRHDSSGTTLSFMRMDLTADDEHIEHLFLAEITLDQANALPAGEVKSAALHLFGSWSVHRTHRSLRVGSTVAQYLPFRLSLTSGQTSFISDYVADGTTNALWRGRTLDVVGDELFYVNNNVVSPTMYRAPPVKLYSTTTDIAYTDAREIHEFTGDYVEAAIDVTEWHAWVGVGTTFGGQFEGGVNRIDRTEEPDATRFSGLGQIVNQFQVYRPENWSYNPNEWRTNSDQPIEWHRRGPLRRDPSEPLELEFRNGFQPWYGVSIARRRHGDEETDWLYWNDLQRVWQGREDILVPQLPGTFDATEPGNAYVLPPGWGEVGEIYDFRIRYAPTQGTRTGYTGNLVVEAIERPEAGLLPPPRIVRPAAGASVDGTKPYTFIVRIPDPYDALFVRLRRHVSPDGATYEHWQTETDGVIPQTAGWRTDGGFAWHESKGTRQREIAIPLPANWQDNTTTYEYEASYSATRESGAGLSSYWSGEYTVGSLAGSSDISAELYDEYPFETPEAPTWVTRSGGFDPTEAVTLAWRYHPRLLGQAQASHEVIRWPEGSPDAIEYYSGGNEWDDTRTTTNNAATSITMPAGWQPTGTTYHYAVRTRASNGDWSAHSGDLIVAAGPAIVTLDVPVDGQTIGQSARLDWSTDDQVAYQVVAERPSTPQPVIYDSGWVLGSERNARAHLPQHINSGTTDVRVRVRDRWGRTSDWASATACVIDFDLIGPPSIDVTASAGDAYVTLVITDLDEAITYDVERWQHFAPGVARDRIDAAGITADERELVYRLVDGRAPGGGVTTVTHRDYSARAGVDYGYRVVGHYLDGRSSATVFSSIVVT